MDLLFEKVFVNPTPYTDELFAIPVPEDLSAQYEKPDKDILGSLNPMYWPSSSGNFERMRRTTQAGIMTRILHPRRPQHQITNER